MFAIEYTSSRPAGSAPYYSLVIREEPYMIGCLPINDVCLPCHDVSPQHATLEVMRQKQAARLRNASAEAEAEDADEVRSEHEEEIDPALQDPALYVNPPAVSPLQQQSQEPEEVDPNVAAQAAAEAGEPVNADGDEEQPEGEEIPLASDDVVMQANPEEAAGGQPQQLQQPQGPVPLFEEDPLVVRLTALPTKGEGAIIVDGRELAPGESVYLQNGSEVQLCSEAVVVFRFRPLVVSIESTAFTKEYIRDLVYTFRHLGATICNVVSGPTPDLTNVPTPIGLLHCVEELNDSNGCIVALACGYSAVQPTYVFEWFATLAQTPSQPLSVLPPPSRFEVPIRTTVHPRSAMYIRPESDTCPYSLYPIPTTAMRKRNRAELFLQRTFFLASPSSADKYMATLAQCGGIAYGPEDVEAVKAMLRDMVAAQPNTNLELAEGEEEHPYPSDFYIIVDNAAEAAMLNDGLRSADPELCQFMEDINAIGATHVPILGDHSLFTSLLSNHFSYEPVQYSVDPPLVLPTITNTVPSSSSGLIAYHAFSAGEGYQPYEESAEPLRDGGVRRGLHQPGDNSSPGRRSSASARRRSLLPHNRGRTPSRSQMRSASRQRQRSQSTAASETVTMPVSARSGSRGRRHLVQSPQHSSAKGGEPLSGSQLSVGDRFDILRIRIYAFLVREEPKLDVALATFQRSYFVDDAVVERALEAKAQAEEYMEQVDQLLDEGGYGPYTDSLRRFWRDCSDLSVKADKVLANFGKQARSRKPNSRRASSTYGSRAGSMSREGNEIFDSNPNLDGSSSNGVLAPQDSNTAVAPPPPVVAASPRSGAGGAVSPRTGNKTASVREHRDAYLSLGGQRMSLSASLNKSQGGGGAGAGANPLQSSTHSHSSQRGASTAANANTKLPTETMPDSAIGEEQPQQQQQQQQQQQRHADPTPSATVPTPTLAVCPQKPQQQPAHKPIQSDVQRRRQQAAGSPLLVRSGSRGGARRVNSQPNNNNNVSVTPAGDGSTPALREGTSGVRRAPPPKPYKDRESSTKARKGPSSARPAWQN